MKFINKYKSPNFNNRLYPKILFIIIHYTAIKSCDEALMHLCDTKKKVSCHFLISQKGEIFSLVDEKKKSVTCRSVKMEYAR